MTANILGLASGLMIVLFAVAWQRDKQRTRSLIQPQDKHQRKSWFFAVGVAAGRVPGLRTYVRDETQRVNLILTAIVAAILCVESVKIAIAVAVLMMFRTKMAARRGEKLRRKSILRELPLVADLLRLCVAGGMNVSHAVKSVSRFLDGPIAAELKVVQDEVATGARLADSLDAAARRLCDDVEPLFGALVSSERYGAPLSKILERLAFESRRAQEHRAEQAARRLSVKMLFPVAVTILPAFALLTVAPLLAGSFGPLASAFH